MLKLRSHPHEDAEITVHRIKDQTAMDENREELWN